MSTPFKPLKVVGSVRDAKSGKQFTDPLIGIINLRVFFVKSRVRNRQTC